MTTIERMAAAGYEASQISGFNDTPWHRLPPLVKAFHQSNMLAALRELRDNPPECALRQMPRRVLVGGNSLDTLEVEAADDQGHKEEWQLMIHQIIAEHEAAR